MGIECGANRRQGSTILWAIAVHGFLVFAICDIYYYASINRGAIDVESVEPSSSSGTPPAKRLVLFLVEGLRYDAIFTQNYSEPLFLQETGGSKGVARASFPTVASSGYEAIIAGTDPHPLEALFGHWFQKRQLTDSLLHQSKGTWYWGTREAFAQLKTGADMKVYKTFPVGDEDYSEWVNINLKRFVKSIDVGREEFQQDGTVFMIQIPAAVLIGAYGESNVVHKVDNIVKSVTKYFTETFLDNSTAFVVACPYAMNSFGGFGGDLDGETETPFIAWGSGIKYNAEAVNMTQKDIAPLLACLIGVPIPVHSLGVIRLDYLDLKKEHYMSEQATNALQLFKLYKVMYRLYKDVHDSLTPETLEKRVLQLKHFRQKHEEFVKYCSELIGDLVMGIRFHQNYDRAYLVSSVLFGYSFWILAMFNGMVFGNTHLKSVLPPVICSFLTAFYVATCWEFRKYVYLIFPLVMCWLNVPSIQNAIVILLHVSKRKQRYFAYFGLVQYLVVSFFANVFVSILLFTIAFIPYIPTTVRDSFPYPIDKLILWETLCLILTVFSALPLLPPSAFSLALLIYSFFIWIYLFSTNFRQLSVENVGNSSSSRVIRFQKGCFVAAAVYRLLVYFHLTNCAYLPWLISVLPIVAMLFTNSGFKIKFILPFLPFYVISSFSNEPILLALYVLIILVWKELEMASISGKSSTDRDNDRTIEEGEDVSEEVYSKKDRLALVGLILVFVGALISGTMSDFESNNFQWIRNCLVSGAIINTLKLSVPVIICVSSLSSICLATYKNTIRVLCSLIFVFDLVMFELLVLFLACRNTRFEHSLSHFMSALKVFMVVLFWYTFSHCMSILPCRLQKMFNLNK